MPHQFPANGLRQQIAMKSFSGKRAGDRAIGANQPEIEAQLLRDWQSKRVPPARDQNDLNPERVARAAAQPDRPEKSETED